MKTDGFIGYWGCNSSPEFEAILRTITAGKSTKVLTTNCWGVAYFCREEISTPAAKNVIASVSASGFNDAADVWVKLENDCLILGREPFGRVPLYWAEIERAIWFASQLQLLLSVIANLGSLSPLNPPFERGEFDKDSPLFERGEFDKDSPLFERGDFDKDSPLFERGDFEKDSPLFERGEFEKDSPPFERGEFEKDSPLFERGDFDKDSSPFQSYALLAYFLTICNLC